MYRSGVSLRPGGRSRLALLAPGLALSALLPLLPLPAAAQTPPSHSTSVELTRPVQQTLVHLQEDWLQWITAFYQNNRQRGDSIVDDLLATTRQVGMERLPDLSLGALVRAEQVAGEGDFARAAWALAAAERLDPGRPETAFATAAVARREGAWPRAALAYASGYLRLSGMPIQRYLFLQDGLLWLLAACLLAGALLVALLVAVKGGAVYHDLVQLLSRRVSPVFGHVGAILLLVWPLALPLGLLWLVLYWSVLLWGYGSTSERLTLIGLWLLLGVAPSLIAEQRQDVATELSPPVVAMNSLLERRLYGGLFSDLGVLGSVLPDSVAVKHLMADLHRWLGQWDRARGLYKQVVEAEPQNAPALLNLGAYYFYKQDFGSAIGYFKQAVAADPTSAAAYYDLSQAYSLSYLFEDSKEALRRAREIDDSNVTAWIQEAGREHILTFDGGLSEIPKIRQQLAARRQGSEAVPAARLELLRRGATLLAALGLIVAAIALHLVRRKAGYSQVPLEHRLGGGWIRRLSRLVWPGLASAEVGEGARAYLALLLPVALLTLPLGVALRYRIPWGYDPGNLGAWLVAGLGLLAFVAVRVAAELRDRV